MNKLKSPPFLVPQVRLGPSPKIGSMTGGQSNEIRSRMRTRVYYFKIQILERYFLASLDFFLFTKLIFVHQILCQRIKSKMGTKNHFLANLLVMLFCSDICDITSEFREDSCYNFAFRFGRWRNPPAMTWEAGTLVAGRLSSTDNAPGMRSLRPVTSREPSPARPLPIGPFFFLSCTVRALPTRHGQSRRADRFASPRRRLVGVSTRFYFSLSSFGPG